MTHVERSGSVDVTLAVDQWQRYVEALVTAGFAVHEVQPAPDCPDGVFVEDPLLVFDDLAVLAAPSARSRQPEVSGARAAARSQGLRTVELTDAPVDGTVALDGGDVLRVGDTVYVGVGGRTTEAGAAALAHYLRPVGFGVAPVPVSKTLHLKSQVTALPDGAIVGYEPLVDDPSSWPTFLAVPEPEGAHVVVLDQRTVLMADAAPRSADTFRARGLTVVAVPMSELIKLEGCVTCLSVRGHAFD